MAAKILRDLALPVGGLCEFGSPWEGFLASELSTGFPLANALANDIDAGFPDRLYSVWYKTQPSAGMFLAARDGTASFTGAPDGTYSGTMHVDKFDPGVGRVYSQDGPYTYTVGSVAALVGAAFSDGTFAVAALVGAGFTDGTFGVAALVGAGFTDGTFAVAAADAIAQVGTAFDGGTYAVYVTVGAAFLGGSFAIEPPTFVIVAPHRILIGTGANQPDLDGTFIMRAGRPTIDKDPDDVLYYAIDLTADMIASKATLRSVVGLPQGVTQAVTAFVQDNMVVAKISGGGMDDPDAVYSLTFRFTNSLGEIEDRTIYFRMVEK